MCETLSTQRLLLRRFTMSDVPAMHAILSDSRAMQYWSCAPHTDMSETENWIAETIQAVNSGEGDDFAIIKEDRLIGKVGLWDGLGLGIILGPAFWGKGFASEAVQAVIDRSRSKGLPRIVADIDPRNIRVYKLLKRLGFRKTGEAKNTYNVGDVWTHSEYLTLDLS